MGKQKKVCRYMHTLNGRPAKFNGEQVLYAERGAVETVATLALLRHQQMKSKSYRRRLTGRRDEDRYSYLVLLM